MNLEILPCNMALTLNWNIIQTHTQHYTEVQQKQKPTETKSQIQQKQKQNKHQQKKNEKKWNFASSTVE